MIAATLWDDGYNHDLLLFLQDGIVNYCEHVGHMVTFRHVKAPEKNLGLDILLKNTMKTVNKYEEPADHIPRFFTK